MATKIAKVIFALLGVLFMIAGLLPAIQSQPLNTRSLSSAVVLFLLALGLRSRRPPVTPPGPGV